MNDNALIFQEGISTLKLISKPLIVLLVTLAFKK